MRSLAMGCGQTVSNSIIASKQVSLNDDGFETQPGKTVRAHAPFVQGKAIVWVYSEEEVRA